MTRWRVARSWAAMFVVVGLAFGVPSGRALTAQRQDSTTLGAGDPGDVGKVVERPLRSGSSHRYTIALRAGEYVCVVIDQQGIDIVAQSRDAEDHAIAEFEDNIRGTGEERVEVVADADGTYGVVVHAAPGIVAAGAYAIRIADRRPSTPADRALQESRRLRTAASRLDEEGRSDAAQTLLERAMAITEAQRGPDSVQAAVVATQLANVVRKRPDDRRSEALYERARVILERALGVDD